MITDATLEAVVTSEDTSVLVEIYDEDAAPPFDPSTALKRYSTISGITLDGNSYTRLITNVGRVRRTIGEEANTFSVTFDNLDNEISEFELDPAYGFEGLIIVVRLISRTLSTDPDSSLLLFVGRCEKPESGTRESLTVKANQIFNAIDVTMPRRKFSPDDPSGRYPSDPLFEGFRFMPQYGVTTYSERVKRGGLFGLFGVHKRVTRTLQYSSFSDLDAERYVPFASGRVQLAGVHIAYADLGTRIRMTTAICEGPIEAYTNWRTDDLRFVIDPLTTYAPHGFPGGTGDQFPHPNAAWIGNGYYSRTVFLMSEALGTSILDVDPAPTVIIVILATLMPLPDSGGVWTGEDWSDDAAALTRFLLTNDFYGKLSTAWIDDDYATASYNYNRTPVFDSSWADIIFVPGTSNFSGGDSEKGRFLLPTGSLSAEYFEYLNGDKTAEEAFFKTAFVQEYTLNIPIDPPDPPEDPFPRGGSQSSLTFLLKRRYTCNVVLTEETSLVDFLNKCVFVSSRLYLTQAPDGRIRINNKKPVDWGLGTAALSGTTIALDDISAWINNFVGLALVDPNTANSELRTVTDANYSTAQNSVTLTSTCTDISITGFAGCDGANTPATATIDVIATADSPADISLDGTTFSFTYGTGDTVFTIAAFIAYTINAHPVLSRKFSASWAPGDDFCIVTGKFGSLVLDTALEMTHTAPVANPSAAPVLTETASGSLAAGTYRVAYSYVNSRGQTLRSPVGTVTIAANKKITVTAITPPAGTTVNWYVSVSGSIATGGGLFNLRFLTNNSGASFVINSLPLLTDPITPDFNRTGAEVMRVSAAFSDRAETRTAITRSNVLRATYKWLLGNRARAINTIELKFRDSTQDMRLITLILKDEDHIAKTHKRSKEEFNGQAIDNYNQAYRVAAGLLAELRDADFFYEWESDREALLLEEGDVVAITDSGAGVYNLPVRIEAMDISTDGGFCRISFTARKYTTTLYDDSIAERMIPVVIETAQGLDFV